MATKIITITTQTGANPDNPAVKAGVDSIKFQCSTGTHTVSNLPDIFTTAPGTVTLTPQTPKTLTVKSDAVPNEYSYTVDGNSQLVGDGKKPQIKVEP